jgi:hypothetical protein
MGLGIQSPRTGRIRVEVARGPTASTRWIAFMVYGQPHALVVDARDVKGNALWVAVIEEQRDQTMIEIPMSSVASYRIRMPRSSVSLQEPPPDRLGLASLASLLLSVIRWVLT